MDLSTIIASLSPDRPILVVELEPETVESFDLGSFVQVDEFACRDASCRPPTSGGTGGSSPRGSRFQGGGPGTIGGNSPRTIGSETHEADMDLLISTNEKPFTNNVTNPDGTLGLPFTKPGGKGTIEHDEKMDAWVADHYKKIGTNRETLVANLVADAKGAIEMPGADKAIAWYDTENKWGTQLADTYGVSPDRIFAAVSLTSAMRKWGVEGTGTNGPSTNKGAIETLLRKMKEDEPFEVSAELAERFNSYKGEKRLLGEGTRIEPGTYRPSDLSSVTMARLATDLGWKVLNTAGAAPVAKAIAVLRGELDVNSVVRGTKQRSFVSNLAHPEIDYTSTNDLWHMRAIAGSTPLNFSDRRRNQDGTQVVPGKGNKITQTLKEYEDSPTKWVNKKGVMVAERGNAPHDIFTGGPPHGGFYTEMTKVTRQALDQLAASDVRFRGMKIHEFQALVWKYAGGNSGGGGDEA